MNVMRRAARVLLCSAIVLGATGSARAQTQLGLYLYQLWNSGWPSLYQTVPVNIVLSGGQRVTLSGGYLSYPNWFWPPLQYHTSSDFVPWGSQPTMTIEFSPPVAGFATTLYAPYSVTYAQSVTVTANTGYTARLDVRNPWYGPGAYVQISGAGLSRVDITADDPERFSFLGIGYFGLIIGEADKYIIRAGLDIGQPETEETVEVGSSTPTARVPLGSTFHLQMLKKDSGGNLLPVRTSVQVGTQTTSGLISQETFFPQTVLLSYSDPGADQRQLFSAVHRGVADVTLVGTDPGAPQATLHVQVDMPCRLGSSSHKLAPPKDVPWPEEEFPLDWFLAYYGNFRGVPPHILKGQVKQESRFHLNAYRYEPSIDLKWISGGQRLLFSPLYSTAQTAAVRYGLPLREIEAPAGLGTELAVPEDLRPRSDYQTGNSLPNYRPLLVLADRKLAEQRVSQDGSMLQGDPKLRVIDSSPANWDKLVTAREIVDVNNGYWNWVDEGSLPGLRPKLLFSAQTTLAASYGLLQILYPVAIERDFSKESGKSPHPYLLFDTLGNLSGTASIHLGTKHLVLKECGHFWRKACDAAPAGLFRSPSDWMSRLSTALVHYNGDSRYGKNVISNGMSFLPVARSQVFQATNDTSCEVWQ